MNAKVMDVNYIRSGKGYNAIVTQDGKQIYGWGSRKHLARRDVLQQLRLRNRINK